ncbi:MAG: glycosyltransferase family 2 protein [Acidobacteria bacterium]|nr:glycosyltransferase family 2 protein [Acidobacteriota bacterium]MBA3804614.1 glycosyltransferase family 2 protein [Acidobacteriota bacterium]
MDERPQTGNIGGTLPVGFAISIDVMLEQSSAILNGNNPQARAETHQPVPSLVAEPAVFVSVVIPCRNEERFIGKVLEHLSGQYTNERYEIIIVDGMSTDKTREVIAEFVASHTDVQVHLVDNPARNIPTALNRGISHASGEIIVRMDAHSIPSANYIRRCVELLSDRQTSVVGMPWRIHPGAQTQTARAIALAVSHPFGIGDAKYRQENFKATQIVDTVPFGVFRKALWQELGGFNESLLANEDYEFFYRVRQAGGRALLDGSGHCNYFARATMGALATQYFRYGTWKAQMIKLYPRSIRLRQLVAPLFVLALLLFPTLGFWLTPALWALFAMLGTYTLLALLFGFQLSRRKGGSLKLMPVIALVFFVIHVAWGSGFLLGLVRSPGRGQT